MTYPVGSIHPLSLFFFCLFVLGITIFVTDQPLADPDIYLHIAAGRWIDLHHAIPLKDPFSFTALGQPWVSHEWLAQWMLYRVYALWGWAGLVLVGAICFGLTLSILTQFLTERLPLAHSMALLALSFACMATHFNVRPHVLVWPILAWWTSCLIRSVEHRESPPWVCILVMLAWVNLHGSFLLGLVVLAIAAIEAVTTQPHSRRAWVLFCVLSCLACLANPSGWRIFTFVLSTLQLDTLHLLSEWSPPAFNGPNFLALYILFIIGYGLAGRLRLPWNRLVFLLLLLYQAMNHGRYVSILGILAPFFVAGGLVVQAQEHNFQRPSLSWRNTLTIGMLVMVAALFIAWARHDRYQPAKWMTPKGAVNAIEAHNLTGNGLHHMNYGAYLIYRDIPVFMDARLDLYKDAGMNRYLEIEKASDPVPLALELDRWGIQWTLFPKQSQINLFFSNDPAWGKIYEDDQSVAFSRTNAR